VRNRNNVEDEDAVSQAPSLNAVLNSTDLASERTRMAAERTLIAWIRTALSMISFGFTIYKFLQAMQESQKLPIRPNGPRNLGLTLIALGTIGLILACIQHRSLLKQLRYSSPMGPRWSLAMSVAVSISLLGTLAFVSIALRMGPY
jgi:putative membrane protein